MNTRNQPSCFTLARCALVLGSLLLVSACNVSTIASRTQEMPAVYANAAPAEQKMMSQGWIDRGFTPSMVYIALGKPDKIVTTKAGTDEFWIYMNFDSAPASAALGKARITVTQGGSSTASSGSSSSSFVIGNRANYSVRPDVGGAEPAEEIPRLFIYFKDGHAVGVELKREKNAPATREMGGVR